MCRILVASRRREISAGKEQNVKLCGSFNEGLFWGWKDQGEDLVFWTFFYTRFVYGVS